MTECLWQQNSRRKACRGDALRQEARIVGRVLHVVNGEHYAGAERVQDLLAGALPWFGYEMEIACVKPGQFSSVRKNVTAPLFDFPMRNRFDLRPVRPLARMIRDRGYDLIHAHTPRSLMLASAASVLARVPLVYHVHSPALADSTNRLRNWANAALERTGLASAAHLIAVSDSLRRRYLRLGFSPKRITAVPNGVPCGSRLNTRSRSANEPTVFGMAALFRPRKGLEVLLQAIAKLLAAGHRLRLRAIGEFESEGYQRQVTDLAAQLGVAETVDWTGFSNDIEREMAQIDCFVLPSLFGEGLPMVVLEAMACGRPVIATEVEGVPEAIRHGHNGLLAQRADPETLAESMKLVLEGSIDLASLARHASDDQRERFSVCSMTRGVAHVYDRVLGRIDDRGRGRLHDLSCMTPESEAQSATTGPLLPSGTVTPIPPVPR